MYKSTILVTLYKFYNSDHYTLLLQLEYFIYTYTIPFIILTVTLFIIGDLVKRKSLRALCGLLGLTLFGTLIYIHQPNLSLGKLNKTYYTPKIVDARTYKLNRTSAKFILDNHQTIKVNPEHVKSATSDKIDESQVTLTKWQLKPSWKNLTVPKTQYTVKIVNPADNHPIHTYHTSIELNKNTGECINDQGRLIHVHLDQYKDYDVNKVRYINDGWYCKIKSNIWLNLDDASLAYADANLKNRFRPYMADLSLTTFDHKNITIYNETKDKALIAKGASQWQKAGIKFIFTNNRENADIIIRNHKLPKKTNGTTVQTGYKTNGSTRQAIIDLDIKQPNKSKSEQINIVSHELGHALGLDHSNAFNSVMYPFGGRFKPAPFDIDKVRAYYKDIKA